MHMSTVMSGILHGAYIALAVLFLWMMNVAWHIVMQCKTAGHFWL